MSQNRREFIERLQFKRCLIVIDDVWNAVDLEPFLQSGPDSARLITTRQVSIANFHGADPLLIEAMMDEEALQAATTV